MSEIPFDILGTEIITLCTFLSCNTILSLFGIFGSISCEFSAVFDLHKRLNVKLLKIKYKLPILKISLIGSRFILKLMLKT